MQDSPPAAAATLRSQAAVSSVTAMSAGTSRWQQLLRFSGPGLLISVGYMDPGNWATDIESGSRFGFNLLFVVGLTSLAAMLLQTLALRLGLVARMDLARACRASYRPPVNIALWLLAEIGIIACDVAEVLGTALALQLLFGVPLPTGVALTALDTLIILALRGSGLRKVEAFVLALVLTVTICFVIELALVGPDWSLVTRGFVPRLDALRDPQALYLAVAILGATVMPHNLYLHSSIVQQRHMPGESTRLSVAIRLCTADAVVSLLLALFVNAAILMLAASAFHGTGHTEVHEIQDAFHLLEPIVGMSLASVLFAIALLAAGQSSTLTGTIAGQVILEGFLDLKIAAWQRRLITRALALVPALGGVLWFGEGGVGKLLVASQVVLSFQLPFAVWPLLRFTSNRALMGSFTNGMWLASVGWAIFALIVVANVWLLVQY
jgi:manganese transport protein